MSTEPTGPLAGLLVVDCSTVLAGPFCTMLLADLGADVIKVEPPDGDSTRGWGPPWVGADDEGTRTAAYYLAVNRNKRSLRLDLRQPDGARVLRRLIERSDALELVLRCLDRGAARSLCMSHIAGEQLARDFNAEFAGRDAANEAEQESRRLAAAETAELRKTAAERDERRAKAARERGAPPPRKRTKVEAVKPVPMLDPGFDSLAQSKEKLSRAEVCLLLASTLRIGSANVSALQRAASRAAKTG